MILALLACNGPTAPVETSDPDPTPLPWTDISNTVERLRAEHRVPALAATILSPDGIEAFGIAGTRQRGGDDPITWDDSFHLGSLTKSMTGTLAARFVDAGGVEWTTTVESVWPHAHADWHGVTLEQLLKHQSGAAENPEQAVSLELYDREDDPRAAREWLVEQTLASPPATPRNEYVYSNLGIILAGAMLEEVFDEAWEVQIRRELFVPLGMDRCDFGPPLGDAPWGHLGPEPVDPSGPRPDNPNAFGPAGTVACPVEDYSNYLVAHLTQDPALVSAASWQVLHQPASGDYAAGWSILNDQPWAGGSVLAHDGSNNAWLATAFVAPGIDRAYVVLTNRADTNATDAVQATLLDLIDRE